MHKGIYKQSLQQTKKKKMMRKVNEGEIASSKTYQHLKEFHLAK